MEILNAFGWLLVIVVGWIIVTVIALVFVLCIAAIVVAVKDRDGKKVSKDGKNK